MKKIVSLFAALALFATTASATIVNSLPYNLTNGSLADATQVMANFNQIVNNTNTNGAHNGANNDITSLTGLTIPLAPSLGGASIYVGGTTGGSGNAQTLATVVPSNFALTAGNIVTGIAGFTNTGATTLAVNGLAATAVRVENGGGLTALVGGEIVTGNAYVFYFDGTFFDLINPSVIANASLAKMNANTIKMNNTGSAAFPTDVTVTAFNSSALKAIITVKRQIFTSTGTYTPSTGMVYAELWCIGGGGGGGGVSTSSGSAGGGGAAGSESKLIASAATIGASQAVTIGGSGTAGSNSGGTGGTGGTSSVGSLVTCLGGLGGQGGNNASAAGGAGQNASGGDFNGTGAAGGGATNGNTALQSFSGAGGSSSIGGGAAGLTGAAASNGNNGVTNTGGGGGGAVEAAAGVGKTGGAGGTGFVAVTEYVIQ